MMEDKAVCMCHIWVIAALMKGGMDIILIEEAIVMGVHDVEVPDMGPVAALAGANEDWWGVDGVVRVEEVIKSALVGVPARKVGCGVYYHVAFAMVEHIAQRGKEDAINKMPQEVEEGESEGVPLIVHNLGRELGDERA